jgi:hypothetical protein
MFTHHILAVLTALQLNTTPVSKIEVPAGQLGGVTISGVRDGGGSCAAVVRTDPGEVPTLVAHRTNSKVNYDVFFTDEDERPVASAGLLISILPPHWTMPQEVVVSVAGETTIMINISEFNDADPRKSGLLADNKFISFATCIPETCSCKLDV